MDKKEQKQMTAGKEIIPEKAVQKEETKQEPAPEIILQYREYEASIDAVTDRVKSVSILRKLYSCPEYPEPTDSRWYSILWPDVNAAWTSVW